MGSRKNGSIATDSRDPVIVIPEVLQKGTNDTPYAVLYGKGLTPWVVSHFHEAVSGGGCIQLIFRVLYSHTAAGTVNPSSFEDPAAEHYFIKHVNL